MTVEEKAIDILKNTNFHFDGEEDPEGTIAQNFCIAYNMAIRSLEAWKKVKQDIKNEEIRDDEGVLRSQVTHTWRVLDIIDNHLKEVEE